jgi:Tfp pilus assembly protein PilX
MTMRRPLTRLARLGRALRLDERGIALPLAIVVSASLAISTLALTVLMVSGQGSAARSRDTAQALSVAEAGLNNALSVISQRDPSGSLAVGSTIPATTISLDNAQATFSATKTAPTEWTISSTGTSPSGAVTRRLELTVAAETTTTSTPASPVYGYGFFVGSATGCTSPAGNVTIRISIFVRNSLCLSGSSVIEEPVSSSGGTLTVYIGGTYHATGTARIGSASKRIGSFTAVGGCTRNGANAICSNAGQSRVYANAYSSTPSTLVKPEVDPAAVYASGRWSAPICATGSFTFDNDTVRNGSVGTVDLLQGGSRPSFDCTVRAPDNVTPVGRLAWDASTNTLTIDGTIFIDGGLAFAGGAQGRYTGSGTIYANGSVSVSGNAALCGPPSVPSGSTCSGQWNPSLGALEIVALSGWSMSGNAELNVIAFVEGHYSAVGTTVVTGPVIADTATLQGNSKFTAISEPPPGAPGAATSVTTATWAAAPGSWRQLTR